DSDGQILLEGNVTAPALLTAVDGAIENTTRGGAIVVGADGRAAIESPSSVLRSVAAQNETVADAIATRDTNGDGLPDQDTAAVYDLLFDAAPEEASSVLSRADDGSYQSARLTVGVQGNASTQAVA